MKGSERRKLIHSKRYFSNVLRKTLIFFKKFNVLEQKFKLKSTAAVCSYARYEMTSSKCDVDKHEKGTESEQFCYEASCFLLTLGYKNHKSCKILPKFSSTLHFLQESYKFVQESQTLQICYNVEHFLQDSDNIFAKNAFFW